MFKPPKILECKLMTTYLSHEPLTPIQLRIEGWGWLRIRSNEKKWRGHFKRFNSNHEINFNIKVPLNKDVEIIAFNLFGSDKKNLKLVASDVLYKIADTLKLEFNVPKLVNNSPCKIQYKHNQLSFQIQKFVVNKSLKPSFNRTEFSAYKINHRVMLPKATYSFIKMNS